MANDTGIYSVKHLLNRILNSTSDAIKVNITEITLEQGATLLVKDYRGFTLAEFRENGDLAIKGDFVKI